MWWSVFTLSQKATTAYRPLGSSKRKWTWKESRSSANEYWNFNRDLNWALGLNERPLVPSTNQNVNFLCDLREDAKQKNHKKFPFGKETSVASYYLARITSAITSVFRSPIVFASEVHMEPFQYVRVCKPTSFKSRCSFAFINRKSGIVSIVFQVPSDQASGVVEFYFQSSVLSLSHPSRVDVDRRLPITTTSFPFYIPIWWTRSCGEIKIHDFEGFHQKRNVSVIIQFRYSRNLNPRCDLRFQVLLNCFPTPRSPCPEGIN